MFTELENTYDNILLIKLWKALEETGISCTMIAIVKELCRKSLSYINLLKPTGHVMHQQFNI